jgi:acyl dehydratase
VPERALQSPPRLLGLMVRAGLPGGRATSASEDDATLVLAERAPDRDRLARYARVCGFDIGDALPPTYPHVLAFGMQMMVLTDPAFPLRAAGLVHIANRITRRRRIDVAEPLQLRVDRGPLTAHPRGRSVALHTEARAGGETVWEEWSTMLSRGEADPGVSAPPGPPPATDVPCAARWRLPGDLGRRYAAVSGDANPIHLHRLTAKPFGFPRPLAHGMWTLARCLAALGPELPEAVEVDVAFRRPLLLAATVEFAERADAAGITFGVRAAGDATRHLDGIARPLRQSSSDAS